jgi:phosphopantetheinyl transferase
MGDRTDRTAMVNSLASRGSERTHPAFQLVVIPDADVPSGIEERLGRSDRARFAGLDELQRRRFLAGRAAVLAVTERLVGRPLPGLAIDAVCDDCGGAHGRPVVSGVRTNVHVSIAHANGLGFAVAAWSPVGVDAQPLQTPHDRLAAVRALTGERGDLLGRWTAVEAILKADGRGLRVDPAEVLVGRRHGRVADRGIRYRLHREPDLDGCVVTIAVAAQDGRGGSAGSSVRRSHASKSGSSGASANPAANARNSTVDATP